MATILSANRSKVLINGKTVEGLQEIAYQTIMPHQDIAAIGEQERVGVVYGMTRVSGTLRVRSVNDELEQLSQSQDAFSIVASLKHVTPEGEVAKELSLDGCQLHGKSFGLAAGGVVEVVYQFSALRAR